MFQDKLKTDIENIWWWHSIDLQNGIVTPGHSKNEDQLVYMKIPDDLCGKTVLDIGAWDGYFSFLAESRGAIVTATDDIEHSWGKCATGKRGFDLAKDVLNSSVEEHVSSVYNLSSSILGKFDIVFCFGVFYHLEHPYKLLEIIYDLTEDLCIIETASLANHIDIPVLQFYHNPNSVPRDGNYFAPNILGLTQMLLSVGFKSVEAKYDYPKIANEIRIVLHARV